MMKLAKTCRSDYWRAGIFEKFGRNLKFSLRVSLRKSVITSERKGRTYFSQVNFTINFLNMLHIDKINILANIIPLIARGVLVFPLEIVFLLLLGK